MGRETAGLVRDVLFRSGLDPEDPELASILADIASGRLTVTRTLHVDEIDYHRLDVGTMNPSGHQVLFKSPLMGRMGRIQMQMFGAVKCLIIGMLLLPFQFA